MQTIIGIVMLLSNKANEYTHWLAGDDKGGCECCESLPPILCWLCGCWLHCRTGSCV